jgi:iron-sulfur cluster repair protein YtfE (RIC family)
MLLSLTVSAQAIDSLEVIQVRKLSLELYPLQLERLKAVFAMHDSMPSKDKPFLQRYDSLTRDSLFVQTPAFRAVAIDRALLAMSKGNAMTQYASLKAAFGDVQMPEGLSPYHQEVSAILLEFALEASDYATVYRMQNALHAGAYGDWTAEREALGDSLRLAQKQHAQEIQQLSSSQKNSDKEQAKTRMMLIVLASVLFILCLVAFLFMLKGKKKLRLLRSRSEDTSEKEELVRKLEAAKSELKQHLMAEKKKVEPVVVSAPISSAPSPVVDLSALNDEIQQGLSKIKAHCEAGKQGMSVPTYMSIVNDTTRLSSAVMKRIQSLNSDQPKS